MTTLKCFARYEPTTDSTTLDAVEAGAISKKTLRTLRDVQIYRDKQGKKPFARFPWHYDSKPTRRNKVVTLNCYVWRLQWI